MEHIRRVSLRSRHSRARRLIDGVVLFPAAAAATIGTVDPAR
ncbi:hypothetical protein [Aureimonas sp. AU22]|nr:hypothetical protein [Aureimonas sp. AU22]